LRKIKTLIIEDSGLMRIMISDALREDPDFHVIGTAKNGQDGAKKALSLQPDVVVSDMIMPEYDGLYAVKHIMKKSSIPIILLSSLDRANPEIFDALNAGAFDFIDKPKTKNPDMFKSSLALLKEKIKIACDIKPDFQGLPLKKTNHLQHAFNEILQYEIIALGASTGGPSTIESIVKQLPENLAVPVVISQHMPDRFLVSYAARLDKLIPLSVEMARKDKPLQPGVIYIAAGDGNMAVKINEEGKPAFTYDSRMFKEFNNPSVDCMFESVAKTYGNKCIGVILTGMGRDGSSGLKEIKKNGGLTIAQDGASCIVNGMPQAAIDNGAVDYVVKLKEMPGFIMSCF